jgi:hypothetical protein
MPTFVRLVLGCFLLSSLPGCFVFSFERPLALEDSGADADPAETGPTCTRDPERGELPCRPPSHTSHGSDSGSITFAIREVQIAQAGIDPPAGLNLDGIDSSAGSGNEGQGDCFSENSGVDGPYGIDNTLGLDLWSPEGIGGFFDIECESERMHRRGLGTIIIRVTEWNTDSDDASVTVEVAPAVAGTYQPGWTTPQVNDWTWHTEIVEIPVSGDFTDDVVLPYALDGEGTRPPEPCWLDGAGENDWFFGNPLAFNPVTRTANVRSTTAYVSDNWLVMPVPTTNSFDLYTDRRSVQVKLRDAHIVAKMSTDRSRFERAFIAGRFGVEDMLAVSPSIGLCEGILGTMRNTYLGMADILADPTIERDPGIRCDAEVDGVAIGALSVGVGFEGVRVSYGGIAGEGAAWPVPNACETFDSGRPPPAECDGSWSFTPPAHCPPN